MKRGLYTTCGYIVRKLARKYDLNSIWLWDLLDSEYNMRGTTCAISWEEAEDFEKLVVETKDK